MAYHPVAFLREYLYIALGGNRKGKYRRYSNLFLTMLLGGLWHGAGWPYVIWGALHGSYLIINHGWRHLMDKLGGNFSEAIWYSVFCWAATFVAWVFSLVFFRAPTLDQGGQIAVAMLGFSGFELPSGILARAGSFGEWLYGAGFVVVDGGGAYLLTNYLWVLFSAVIILALPNVAQIFHKYEPVLYESDDIFKGQRHAAGLSWDFNHRWAIVVSVAAVAGILTLQQVSEFLYFQF